MSQIRDIPTARSNGKPEPHESKPIPPPRIGSVVVVRTPGGGVLPLIVDRVVGSLVWGTSVCSRLQPPTSKHDNLPYSTAPSDSSCWCWPEEVPQRAPVTE